MILRTVDSKIQQFFFWGKINNLQRNNKFLSKKVK